MAANTAHPVQEPARSAIDELKNPTVLEFGADWCPICQAAQPLIAAALNEHPHVEHIKIEDGSGRPLGRSFRVKLWPTLIFLRHGVEVQRLVRPQHVQPIKDAFSALEEPST